MELIIDANILFSSLIKNSITAEIIFTYDIKLYSPEYIVEEFLKYQDLIMKKTHRSEEEFTTTMHLLKCVITVISKEEYSKFMKDAEEISPDEKDTQYFALALKLKIPIWTNDSKLKEQEKVKVYSTKEIIELFR